MKDLLGVSAVTVVRDSKWYVLKKLEEKRKNLLNIKERHGGKKSNILPIQTAMEAGVASL